MIYKVNIICSKKRKNTTRGIFRAQPGDCWETPLGRHLPWLRVVRDVAHMATVKQHPTSAPSTGCHSEPAPTNTPSRMDEMWAGNSFLLGSSSLANHGG
jgi:hypothetical protein